MSAITSVFHSALALLLQRIGIRSVVFEVTQACNQECVFCYNVWKCCDYPQNQLDTPHTIEILDRIITGYRPFVLTFTGGEPLLRPDLIDLIKYASKRTSCNLITNGTLVDDNVACDLVKAGIRNFEFTLLSSNRELHNSLVRRDSFDQLIEAIASVRAAGGTVSTTFVATRENIDNWNETLELNYALGVSGILFNRFNIGGAGIEQAKDLIPTVGQLSEALSIASEGAKKYGISISCGTPIPPCIIDRSKYPNVHFTDCAVGTKNAYPTIDPMGNVRPCNHSATILGNLFDSDLRSIMKSEASASYAASIPNDCLTCKSARTCRGGCRAAAEVCGDICSVDPFIRMCEEELR